MGIAAKTVTKDEQKAADMERKIAQLPRVHPAIVQQAGLRNGMSNEQIVRALEANGHEFD